MTINNRKDLESNAMRREWRQNVNKKGEFYDCVGTIAVQNAPGGITWQRTPSMTCASVQGTCNEAANALVLNDEVFIEVLPCSYSFLMDFFCGSFASDPEVAFSDTFVEVL